MRSLLASALLLYFGMTILTGCKKDPGGNPRQPGAVFIMDNATAGNHIIAYKRSADGSLTLHKSYPTEGTGNGMGLGSQGSITVSDDFLFVCNPGSSEITVFSITPSGLRWIDKASSRGTTPVSVTVHGDLVYVLNAGKSSNIAGFRRKGNGHLEFLAQSERMLGSADGLAQVSFNPAGNQLVVTEKATNTIKTFAINAAGIPGSAVAHPAAGKTPFGFAFGKKDHVFVAQAFGGEPGLSALSSYKLNGNGEFGTITGPVPTHQTAACWVAVTRNEKYCYTTNTGSGTISGYSVADNGAVELLNANGVTGVTGGAPADMSLSNDSRYLYTRNGVINTISIFEIAASGQLSLVETVTGIPAGAVGLAAM